PCEGPLDSPPPHGDPCLLPVPPDHPRPQSDAPADLRVGHARMSPDEVEDVSHALLGGRASAALRLAQPHHPVLVAPRPVRQRWARAVVDGAPGWLASQPARPVRGPVELPLLKPRSDLEAHVAHLSKGQCVRRRRHHQRISHATSASCSQVMALTWRWRRASSSSSSIRAPSSSRSPKWTMTARCGASCSATQRPISRPSTTPCVRSASASTISSQDLISTSSAFAW